MAQTQYISDSELDYSQSPGSEPHTPAPVEDGDNAFPQSTLSYRFRLSHPPASEEARERSVVAVEVPAPTNPWEYQLFTGDTTVDSVLDAFQDSDGLRHYRIECEDGEQVELPETELLQLRNGQNALDFFNTNDTGKSEKNNSFSTSEEPSLDTVSVGKRSRSGRTRNAFVDSTTIEVESEEDELQPNQFSKRRRLGKESGYLSTRSSTRQGHNTKNGVTSKGLSYDEMSLDSHDPLLSKGGASKTRGPTPSTRNSNRITRSANIKSTQTKSKLVNKNQPQYFHDIADDEDEEEADELAGEDQDDSENSDLVFKPKKQQPQRGGKHRRGRSVSKGKRGRPRKYDSSSSSAELVQPSRRSGRDRVIKSMKERDMDEEVYADEALSKSAPKVVSVRENFQPISKNDPFVLLHSKSCDICKGVGNNSNKGKSPLVYCQGCSTSIHKACLGYRSVREHLVTKVGPEHFVMQCRRCIGIATKKDILAPRLGACQSCKKDGGACAEFSVRKPAKQEEKLRIENKGEDPITTVPAQKINNPENILFRCVACQRAFHFEHLSALSATSKTPLDVEELHRERFKQYSSLWQCKECVEIDFKVQSLIAWRPADQESYVDGQEADDFREDEKEYLIKWEDQSYFQCTWMPGSWVWGVTAATMRKAFFKRDDGANNLPTWTEEEAIPEEFLRIEIVLDVKYDDEFRPTSEERDKASMSMIDSVFVKFQGLGYEEAAWEDPPDPKDKDRWSDFVAAYHEYVVGQYFRQPPALKMKERVETFRSKNFEKKIEVKKQPSALSGGDMMTYQMEGLNWLLYNFHQKKNVILADEMGLGKTIQIISLIASLVKDKPKCWPFLVVTPNSTCPNWRREIKKWAPSLRVVAFYGGKKARSMAMEYELYPGGCADLRAHVVVTSYEGPVDDSSKLFFRRIKWAGMIVDEGQRLKNDENLLYGALKALKVPFQVLLTGTPLQNNKRELFNLLQFLDKSINAAELDEQYAELTKDNLPELHELIRPFFLRRTKLQVLKFLPPMAQVILPVTMSVVQKRLYRSILAKNGELIKSILGHNKTVLKATERGNLNNILMQLRKCLCHPFVYSQAIEEKNLDDDALHRNLIDASAKLRLLEIMLPKLRDRGHRVLLFSQFLKQLDIVEDFLNGLGLKFQRLDGNIPALEKQKRIDAFNALDSPYFAFILSTRAGGVGINLATADTVIIMDPDFNPHQDIQALSRAHRIGQKNKVLCFQLMTKDSAEEKIVQIGRKKMALDHALIESMGADDDTNVDVESILKHGAEALFNEDDRNDIHYSSASVDQLLDRAQVETTVTDDEKTAESQFSFARVWANNKGDLTEDIETTELESTGPNSDFWDKLLKKREAEAAAEVARNMQTFGRGKRTRQTVDYQKSNLDLDDDMLDASPLEQPRRKQPDSASDQDFAGAGDSDGDDDSEQEGREGQYGTPRESETPRRGNSREQEQAPRHDLFSNPRSSGKAPALRDVAESYPKFTKILPPVRNDHAIKQLTRSKLGSTGQNRGLVSSQSQANQDRRPANLIPNDPAFCSVCQSIHYIGQCKKQLEHCGNCGLAHSTYMRGCPSLSSEIRLRIAIDKLTSENGRPDIDALRSALSLELIRRTQRDK